MSLVSRAQNIIMSPKTEWPVIAVESADVGSLYTGYIMPLAAIPQIASLISMVLFLHVGIVAAILFAVVAYVLALIGVFIISFVAAKLAPSFNGRDDQIQGLKLAAYAYTPGWVAGIAAIIPVLGGIIALVGAIYGLYVLYLGTQPVMGVPSDKSVVYTIVLVIVAALVTGLLLFIPTMLLGGMLAASMMH
jgi:Yip1 domain